MMRAIIIKELRENAKWALLMLLAVAAALAFAIHVNSHPTFSLVGTVMEMVSGIVFPIAGFSLGMLQILQDNRRGRWEFLTHRPISRTNIFFAKVLAGVLLYLAATVVPLAAVIGWVATPGHLAAPFDWHMMLPRFADLFGGFMWYTTGLLIASRKARWIGSRLMPVGLTLLVAVLAWVLPLNLLQALLILGGGIVLTLPAAWAAFDANGVFEKQPAITRFLQAIGVGTGLALSLFAGVAILIALIDSFHPEPGPIYDSYRINQDGQILRYTEGPGSAIQVTDLQGRPVKVARSFGELLAVGQVILRGYPSESSSWSLRREHWGLHGSDAYLRFLGTVNLVQWYYVAQRRTIEGFDETTRRFVGSIGPAGPQPATAPPLSLPEPLYPLGGPFFDKGIYVGRAAVYQMDQRWPLLRPIFIASPDDQILSAGLYFKRLQVLKPQTVIVTRSSIRILDDDKEIFRMPLEYSYPPYESLEIGQARDGRYILHYTAMVDVKSGQPDWVVQADAQGQILKRTELPPLPVPSGDPWWLEKFLMQMLACPPLLLSIAALCGEPAKLIDFVVVGIVAIVSAGTMMLLCRRFAFNRITSILWIGIALLFGIPGVLLVVAPESLPARAACPSCRKRRVVTRYECEHCGATFAGPAMEGIEIFEPAA